MSLPWRQTLALSAETLPCAVSSRLRTSQLLNWGCWQMLLPGTSPESVHVHAHACMCMHIHAYACMCMHMQEYLPTYLPTYMHTHTYIHTSLHIHLYIHSCMHTRARAHIHTGTGVGVGAGVRAPAWVLAGAGARASMDRLTDLGLASERRRFAGVGAATCQATCSVQPWASALMENLHQPMRRIEEPCRPEPRPKKPHALKGW